MEHRENTKKCGAPMLLIHWTDIKPNGGRTGTYGNTVLTDCNPETTTWDDAGCSLGQHIDRLVVPELGMVLLSSDAGWFSPPQTPDGALALACYSPIRAVARSATLHACSRRPAAAALAACGS
jgi:hypothetical protein